MSNSEVELSNTEAALLIISLIVLVIDGLITILKLSGLAFTHQSYYLVSAPLMIIGGLIAVVLIATGINRILFGTPYKEDSH